MRKRFRICLTLLLAGGLAVLFFWARRVQNPQELRFILHGSDEDARALVQRMLLVNKPWLAPAPLQGSYSFRRSSRRYSISGCPKTQQAWGPYTIDRDSPQEIRVGALVWTPLHTMECSQPDLAGKRWFRHGDEGRPKPYTVRMLGETIWKGNKVLGVEVTLESPERWMVGTGGQIDGTYECATLGGRKARILLDECNAIPVLVSVSDSTNGFAWGCTWEFGPRFFKVQDGLAPQSFEWKGGKVRFQQKFQIMGDAWIFKEGRAVWDHSWQPPSSRNILGNLWWRLKSQSWSVTHAELTGPQVQGYQSSSKQ